MVWCGGRDASVVLRASSADFMLFSPTTRRLHHQQPDPTCTMLCRLRGLLTTTEMSQQDAMIRITIICHPPGATTRLSKRRTRKGFQQAAMHQHSSSLTVLVPSM
jgi:hypothetical protein